jgi:secreted PhoX family phosphatase
MSRPERERGFSQELKMPKDKLSFDEFDEVNYPRDEVCEFDRVVERALSRRGFMGGVMSFGLGSFLLSSSSLTGRANAAAHEGAGFDFEAVAATSEDTVTVPEGYEWRTVIRWGDPLFPDAPEFDPETRGTPESQARAFGDNNDGMALFERDGRTIIIANNEYTNQSIMWGNRTENAPQGDEDVRKGMMAHGLSVFEVEAGDEGWRPKTDSELNRRITPETEMVLTGPAAGHDLLKTSADETGTRCKGTWNNCGNGVTPWGTYLTCEENFNGYFSASDEGASLTEEMKRYGISASDWGYGWAGIDSRFDVAQEPNEPNRAGYVVEIDPWDASAPPRKLTALGRFKHENAETVVNGDGRIVVYMGDDERGEFIYRYVSDGTWTEGEDGGDLLEKGTLYAAKFHDDMTGEWLPLTEEATEMSAAELAVFSRVAASKQGATTMDRPEWVAAHPERAEVYVALTNNKNRGVKPNAGGDDTSVNAANPRENNVYGQILRWRPDGEDHTADTFSWDLYALAGNPEVHEDEKAGSENINAGNMFNSPDGMAFDTRGRLWIQTDGNYDDTGDFAGMGNNQMLLGDTQSGEIRRFMVGPVGCEVTGVAWSPDRKTIFVGIQHPGEEGGSSFPDDSPVPRSAIVAIWRSDGAEIG